MKTNKTANAAVCMLFSAVMFAGCGKAASPAETTPAADTEAPAETTVAEETAAAPSEFDGMSTLDFTKGMKLGWNLGNTLDATGKGMSSETSWGQPTTTKEMIDFVKESGFTTIRIPVSWSNHTDADYNIDEAWMNRVNEVVDYAIDDGMFVIINAHHDCDAYYPTEEKYEESSKYLKTIWTQIADRFKDYDEHLIFESMNEPRLKDTSKEWWFQQNDPEGIASIKTIVKLNKDFVEVIRNSGGNNPKRFLMLPSHAASPDNALNDAFEMPDDPANRLIVSVHAYTPYDFAMNKNGYSDWDGSHEGDITWFMNGLDDKFIKNGYGVVIGEFGSTNKDNLEARVAWSDNYTRLAAEHGIPCILWDNGGINVGEENFGMIDRKNLKVFFPEILDAMTKNYNK